MTEYQLTRHLSVDWDSPIKKERGKCLFVNALLGTRMIGDDELWQVLAEYESPRPLGESALESRAVAANIVCPVDGVAEETELVRKFEKLASKILRYRKAEPAPTVVGKLEQLEELCSPLGCFEPPVHYMWQDPKRLFRVMIDHFRAYQEREIQTKQVGPMVMNFAKMTLGRPQRNGDFAQQLCTISTSVVRAERIWAEYPQGAKILTLGDDDLMSLILTQRPGYEVDVFEIDRALVRFIKKHMGSSVRVFSRDLSVGLPEEFRGLYDVVLADPPYNTEGMEWFIDCCAKGMKQDRSSRLYLSTYPGLLENSEHFFGQVEDHDLEVEVTHPYFNRYPFPPDTYQITKDGLIELGYHPGLIQILTEVPYLYANLYECRRRG